MFPAVAQWPHRNIETLAPVPIQRSVAWGQVPNRRLDHSYDQTGLHLETTTGMVCHIQLSFPRLIPGFFFKLVLRCRISLGMSGIRRHLAPTVACQHSVYCRLWNFAPNPFLKCNVDWMYYQYATCSCLFDPGRQECFFFFQTHQLPAASPARFSNNHRGILR